MIWAKERARQNGGGGQRTRSVGAGSLHGDGAAASINEGLQEPGAREGSSRRLPWKWQ